MSKLKRRKTSELEVKALHAPPEPEPAQTPSAPAGAERDAEFGRLGSHVGAVLGAAEEAAARIEREAQAEARRVREEAEAKVAGLVDAARGERDAAKAEAEQVRGEAREWAERTRSEAEAYAADTRKQAEAEAAEIVARAERQGVSMHQDGERRLQSLRLDISHAEKRLRDLVAALHGLADRLNSVLSAPPAREDDTETLAKALAPAAVMTGTGRSLREAEAPDSPG
jgi:hypothetical protein